MSTETKKPFIMGFIGRSGSGKTTLAAAVLRILAARGWRVCAVKDAHHHIDLDTPGKDTWRYRESGASRVILRTPERWAVLAETPEGAPGIDELLKETGDADIVLVEGFKQEGSFPKIEVRRQAAADRPPLMREFGGRIQRLRQATLTSLISRACRSLTSTGRKKRQTLLRDLPWRQVQRSLRAERSSHSGPTIKHARRALLFSSGSNS